MKLVDGADHHQVVAAGGGFLGDVGVGGDARARGVEDFHLRREIVADAGEEQAQDVAGVGGERVVAELIRRTRARPRWSRRR